MPLAAEHRSSDGIPWPQIYGHYLEQCRTVHDAVRARPSLRPDLIVAHGGRGAPTLLLREVVDCPIIIYCEYYFANSHRDISYRIDLPPAEPAPFFPRCINAPTLATLVDCDAGYSATHWQKQSFPRRFHSKIEVHFDGIETELYHPGPAPRRIGETVIPAGTRVVTFVSRGLESIRGFDLFMKVAHRIAQTRTDVVFVVVGGEEIHYGWDKLHTGSPSFKQWVLSQDSYDLSRFIFLGRILPEQLADILRISDLHIYLTAPFVLSWSLLDAMATRLRGAGGRRAAGARGDRAGPERPGRAALRRRTADRDSPAGARRSGRIRPAGPRGSPDDRGKLQPGNVHPASGGVS